MKPPSSICCACVALAAACWGRNASRTQLVQPAGSLDARHAAHAARGSPAQNGGGGGPRMTTLVRLLSPAAPGARGDAATVGAERTESSLHSPAPRRAAPLPQPKPSRRAW